MESVKRHAFIKNWYVVVALALLGQLNGLIGGGDARQRCTQWLSEQLGQDEALHFLQLRSALGAQEVDVAPIITVIDRGQQSSIEDYKRVLGGRYPAPVGMLDVAGQAKQAWGRMVRSQTELDRAEQVARDIVGSAKQKSDSMRGQFLQYAWNIMLGRGGQPAYGRDNMWPQLVRSYAAKSAEFLPARCALEDREYCGCVFELFEWAREQLVREQLRERTRLAGLSKATSAFAGALYTKKMPRQCEREVGDRVRMALRLRALKGGEVFAELQERRRELLYYQTKIRAIKGALQRNRAYEMVLTADELAIGKGQGGYRLLGGKSDEQVAAEQTLERLEGAARAVSGRLDDAARAILEVNQDATWDDIVNSYVRLSIQLHPDALDRQDVYLHRDTNRPYYRCRFQALSWAMGQLARAAMAGELPAAHDARRDRDFVMPVPDEDFFRRIQTAPSELGVPEGEVGLAEPEIERGPLAEGSPEEATPGTRRFQIGRRLEAESLAGERDGDDIFYDARSDDEPAGEGDRASVPVPQGWWQRRWW